MLPTSVNVNGKFLVCNSGANCSLPLHSGEKVTNEMASFKNMFNQEYSC